MQSRKGSSLVSMDDMEELDKLELEVSARAKQSVKINNYSVPINEGRARKSREERP